MDWQRGERKSFVEWRKREQAKMNPSSGLAQIRAACITFWTFWSYCMPVKRSSAKKGEGPMDPFAQISGESNGLWWKVTTQRVFYGYSMRPLANFSIEPLSKLKILLNACLLNIKNISSQLDWLKNRYVMSGEQTFWKYTKYTRGNNKFHVLTFVEFPVTE